MKKSIIKPILFGAIFGTAIFYAPLFVLKTFLFLVLMSFIFRMFWWSRSGGGRKRQYIVAYADKVRNMSEEEYNAFKSKVESKYSHCGRRHNKSCHSSEVSNGNNTASSDK